MIDPKNLLTPDVHEQLLDTPEKIQRATMELQALQAQPGWIFIERVLKIHIDGYADRILNDETLTGDEEKDCKRERAFLLLFKSLPIAWVHELLNSNIQTDESQDDPFA